MTRRTRDLIVVGASAGGVQALRRFVSGLPAGLPAAILVMLDLPADATGALAAILRRSGPLPAVSAYGGQRLEHGRIHVAPTDHHVQVVDGAIVLSHQPDEDGTRPDVNVLFRSAALAAGPAVTGVLLSGVLDDGVAGLAAIAARGGRTMVQDPADAVHSSLPEQALRHLEVDHVLPAAEMGRVLAAITAEVVADVTEAVELPVLGSPVLSVPADILTDRAAGSEPLRVALRVLDERVDTAHRMTEHAVLRGATALTEHYRREAEAAEQAAAALRGYLAGSSKGGLPHQAP